MKRKPCRAAVVGWLTGHAESILTRNVFFSILFFFIPPRVFPPSAVSFSPPFSFPLLCFRASPFAVFFFKCFASSCCPVAVISDWKSRRKSSRPTRSASRSCVFLLLFDFFFPTLVHLLFPFPVLGTWRGFTRTNTTRATKSTAAAAAAAAAAATAGGHFVSVLVLVRFRASDRSKKKRKPLPSLFFLCSWSSARKENINNDSFEVFFFNNFFFQNPHTEQCPTVSLGWNKKRVLQDSARRTAVIDPFSRK